jgi:hypothetical protein
MKAGWATTGIDGFDGVIDGLRIGDNVVWQVDKIEDYRAFAQSFVRSASAHRRNIVYMRFAAHDPILSPDDGQFKVFNLDARSGFEPFSAQIHEIITREGEGAYYVFDCLSDLLSAWATDLMIGNFFLITCPYLFQLDTIAYFGLLRNNHSFKTVARIRETTQVLLDVYNMEGEVYVHPLKVLSRYSPTMFLPHQKQSDQYIPLTSSVDAARILSHISGKGVEYASRHLDFWDRHFLEVEELMRSGEDGAARDESLENLCRIMIGREKRIIDLAKRYFSLEDLLTIKSRLIGTGYIGGKTVGMLLARKMLLQDSSFDWHRWLEPHDSFFIGSDVFYTYIVENGWWKLLMQQKTKGGYFKAARMLRERMLEGSFPEQVEEQFWQLIEYFGQSPIIIRSSSLLEDAFGNAFAGKYESIFCVNQGEPEQRFKQFKDCVRRVFASTMGEDALAYRVQRGLDQQDEQMALLVQRVSGSHRKHYFFPDLGGVGISYNTFVWQDKMDPRAGMLRLVAGLGTRAVNRVENDYPRIVALDVPLLKPHEGMKDTRKYSQHHADVLNLQTNALETIPVADLLSDGLDVDLDLLAVRDREVMDLMRDRGMSEGESWILTFDNLLSETPFLFTMKKILKDLETSYNYPVDIEFTVNFTSDNAFQVNLVQCRPLQTRGEGKKVAMPDNVPGDRQLFESRGNFMGGNAALRIGRVIYVDPEGYAKLPVSGKYDIARLIGKLNRLAKSKEETPMLLMGPGRWGTSTPSLGVPVRFAEINKVAAMVEIAHVGMALMPELSFGTHFFQDLVETDIFYVALFPDREDVAFNRDWLNRRENRLTTLVPEGKRYEEVVLVQDVEQEALYLVADIISQRVICYTSDMQGRGSEEAIRRASENGEMGDREMGR